MKKYKKLIISGIAVLLSGVMIINTVWVAAAKVSIEKVEAENPEGIANNYLVDNTEYTTQDTIERMQEVLKIYQTPSNWVEYEEQAGIYIAQEKYADALESMANAIRLSDDVNESTKARLLLKEGCLYTILGDYEGALEDLEECVKYDSQNSEAYLIMAQIYSEKEDYESTLINMEKYLELNPGNAEAEEMIAQMYMAQEDYETAMKWYKAVQESSGSAESYYYYGLCAVKTENYEEALIYMRKAVEITEDEELKAEIQLIIDELSKL